MSAVDARCGVCDIVVTVDRDELETTRCEGCGGELARVWSAPGIVFKGSGFYKNDSR